MGIFDHSAALRFTVFTSGLFMVDLVKLHQPIKYIYSYTGRTLLETKLLAKKAYRHRAIHRSFAEVNIEKYKFLFLCYQNSRSSRFLFNHDPGFQRSNGVLVTNQNDGIRF